MEMRAEGGSARTSRGGRWRPSPRSGEEDSGLQAMAPHPHLHPPPPSRVLHPTSPVSPRPPCPRASRGFLVQRPGTRPPLTAGAAQRARGTKRPDTLSLPSDKARNKRYRVGAQGNHPAGVTEYIYLPQSPFSRRALF